MCAFILPVCKTLYFKARPTADERIRFDNEESPIPVFLRDSYVDEHSERVRMYYETHENDARSDCYGMFRTWSGVKKKVVLQCACVRCCLRR